MRKLEKILTFTLDGFVALAFSAILVITILQVFLRYGFNAAILGGNETMESLFIYTTAIGAAIAVRRSQHIRISVLVDKLPSFFARMVEAFGLMLVAFLNGVMIYYSVPWIQKVGGHESPVMRIPEWTIQISIPIGCGLVILYCLHRVLLMFINNRELDLHDGQC